MTFRKIAEKKETNFDGEANFPTFLKPLGAYTICEG
jgi:hypothetical protein